ncbi:MAG: hypothetical protein J0H86_05700 [Xanthomonadaceae bacterium]|nr:hypothetical protein [Xanthomonadaceae bacterium]
MIRQRREAPVILSAAPLRARADPARASALRDLRRISLSSATTLQHAAATLCRISKAVAGLRQKPAAVATDAAVHAGTQSSQRTAAPLRDL